MSPLLATRRAIAIFFAADRYTDPRETKLKSNIEIAQQAKMRPIVQLASDRLGIAEEHLEPYGRYKAKISLNYLRTLKDQWLLVSVAPAACDTPCAQHLYLQRQLREGLGKDKDRMDRVWLIPDQSAVPQKLMPGLKNAWVLRANEAGLQHWLTPEKGLAQDAHLYLVDPRGDWMMRFPVDADPSRIKKDLARLMKANESWDEPGR